MYFTAKSSGYDFIVANVLDTHFGTGSQSTFDLANGIVTPGVGVDDATMTDLGNGWYECMYEDTCTLTNSVSNFDLYIRETSGVATYAGDGTSGVIVGNWRVVAVIDGVEGTVGEYEFTSYIDTTTARRVRSRVDLETRRINADAGLFDDLSGNFDDLTGLFDDLTGFTQFTDTDVVAYIAHTPDNPAATPTWTDWKKYQAGEYYDRAFKFKVRLTSTTPNVTPAIDYLRGKVQY